MILKVVEVVCFVDLLQVFILGELGWADVSKIDTRFAAGGGVEWYASCRADFTVQDSIRITGCQ